MTTITIPKGTEKNRELVAVPRNVYEDFLAWGKKLKSKNTFKPTKTEKRELEKARKNLARGKYLTIEELEHELGLAR